MTGFPNPSAGNDREALAVIAWHALLQREDVGEWKAPEAAYEAADRFLRERDRQRGGA